MKLSKLISKKSKAQPKALRVLSAEECCRVGGGDGESYHLEYFTFYTGEGYSKKAITGL